MEQVPKEGYALDYAGNKRTQREEVLRVLSDLDWHPYMDLAAVGGVRYSARLLELKRLGYEVETRTVLGKGETGFDYKLKSLTPGIPQPKLVKVFLTEDEAQSIVTDLPAKHAGARLAVNNALGSFRANRHKL